MQNPYSPPGSDQPPIPTGAALTTTAFDPTAIKERQGGAVVLLFLLTCGMYGLYWIYQTSAELHRATRDPNIKPEIDLLLTMLTCGLWSIYTMYRNAQRAHALLWQYDTHRRDQSQTVLVLNVVSLFVGVTALVAAYITQQELNALSRARPAVL